MSESSRREQVVSGQVLLSVSLSPSSRLSCTVALDLSHGDNQTVLWGDRDSDRDSESPGPGPS
eukprot:1577161-Rhodomonas_salina.2